MAKKRRLDTLSPLIASIAILAANPVSASGTWTGFTNQPPAGFSNCLLLTDGTVMCAVGGGSGGNTWYKLTPDSSGSYTNGTWSQLASMNDTRLYYSSEVLPNGNVYVAGGEYGTGGSDARAEIYNPLTNSWSFSSTMPFTATDASAILLPNGNILQSNSQSTYAQYNPNNNSWSGTFGGPDSNETDWVQLPDSSILELVSYGQNTSRYIPSSNSWVNDATVPVALFGYGGELGSAHLLPNGNVFWLGATSNTAIYTPSGNTNPGSWVAGPQIPGGFGAVDSAAAMMANGNILCAVGSTSGFSAPTYFYEYNYTTNSFSQVNGPTGTSDNTSPFTTSMLALPDGGILYQGTGLYEYKPNGSQVSSGAPSVQSITHNSDGSYTLTGTGLDGISEGAKYGDDKQMNSNYPLVRITNNSTGTVYYCRTYNWTPGLVMTGSRTMSTQFAVPSSAPNGSYTLVVSANGIASSGVSFALGSGIVPNGIHTLTPQCSTGSRLDDSGGGTTNGNKIQIWAAATTANQQWNFTSIGGNTYNIAVNLGPYCLDSNGGAAGTAVHLWTCGGYANQQWTVSSVSGGYELGGQLPRRHELRHEQWQHGAKLDVRRQQRADVDGRLHAPVDRERCAYAHPAVCHRLAARRCRRRNDERQHDPNLAGSRQCEPAVEFQQHRREHLQHRRKSRSVLPRRQRWRIRHSRPSLVVRRIRQPEVDCDHRIRRIPVPKSRRHLSRRHRSE
jgi:hypothetical protein